MLLDIEGDNALDADYSADPSKQRYKIVLEYDGTNYCGWQTQAGEKQSIQEAVESAIAAFCSEEPAVYAAGRTDAGVHAFGQVAHFDLNIQREPNEIKGALNHYLEDDIRVLSVEASSADFHARFSAKARSYIYMILNRETPSAILKNRAWHIAKPLDIDSMKKAASQLVGRYDFNSFRSSHCQATSSVRTLSSINIDTIPYIGDIMQGNIVRMHILAPSFLHNQVRIIMGTLRDIGVNDVEHEVISLILGARDRKAAGITAPAHGLYLESVEY